MTWMIILVHIYIYYTILLYTYVYSNHNQRTGQPSGNTATSRFSFQQRWWFEPTDLSLVDHSSLETCSAWCFQPPCIVCEDDGITIPKNYGSDLTSDIQWLFGNDQAMFQILQISQGLLQEPHLMSQPTRQSSRFRMKRGKRRDRPFLGSTKPRAAMCLGEMVMSSGFRVFMGLIYGLISWDGDEFGGAVACNYLLQNKPFVGGSNMVFSPGRMLYVWYRLDKKKVWNIMK